MKKKPTIKRFLAYAIDFFIITLIASLFAEIPLINPTIDEYMKVSEQYTNMLLDPNVTNILTDETLLNMTYEMSYYGIYTSIITLVVTTLYFVVFQFFNQGKTVGKAILKIKVVSKDGKKLRLSQVLLRSLLINSILTTTILIIILSSLSKTAYINYSEYINILDMGIIFLTISMIIIRDDGVGFHDYLANTMVISEADEQKVQDSNIIEENKLEEQLDELELIEEKEEEIKNKTKEKKKVTKKKKTNHKKKEQ